MGSQPGGAAWDRPWSRSRGTVATSIEDGVMVCTPAGAFRPVLAAAVQRALLTGLAQHPPVIICDLTRVTVMDPVCAGVFTVLRHPALEADSTTLLLCGASPAVRGVLGARGVPRHAEILDDLPSALARAHQDGRLRGERLTIEPTANAPGVAMAFAFDVCDRWGLDGLEQSAAMAAASLVVGAVSAKGSRMELCLHVEDHRLHIDVHDGNEDVVPVLLGQDGREPLEPAAVRRAATAWGVQRDPDGGRPAWCALDLP